MYGWYFEQREHLDNVNTHIYQQIRIDTHWRHHSRQHYVLVLPSSWLQPRPTPLVGLFVGWAILISILILSLEFSKMDCTSAAGRTQWYPIPACYPTFFSIPSQTQFSFENHQVSGNPKYQVLPDFWVYTQHFGWTWNIRHTLKCTMVK